MASKYQSTALVDRCRKVMKQISQKEYENGWSRHHQYQYKSAEKHLAVLSRALLHGYDDIVNEAVDMVARYSSKVYMDTGPYFFEPEGKRECRELYSSLPIETKNKILEKRLELVDSDRYQEKSSTKKRRR